MKDVLTMYAVFTIDLPVVERMWFTIRSIDLLLMHILQLYFCFSTVPVF